MEEVLDQRIEFMNISTRHATVEDTEFARATHHSSYRDVVERQWGRFEEREQDIFFANSWKPESHEIILSNGDPVGYCSVEVLQDHIFIHELVISPDHQGKGIGSTILSEIIKDAQNKNIPLRLQVLKANKAQELYRKMGFNKTEETTTHFKMEYLPIKN